MFPSERFLLRNSFATMLRTHTLCETERGTQPILASFPTRRFIRISTTLIFRRHMGWYSCSYQKVINVSIASIPLAALASPAHLPKQLQILHYLCLQSQRPCAFNSIKPSRFRIFPGIHPHSTTLKDIPSATFSSLLLFPPPTRA